MVAVVVAAVAVSLVLAPLMMPPECGFNPSPLSVLIDLKGMFVLVPPWAPSFPLFGLVDLFPWFFVLLMMIVVLVLGVALSETLKPRET